MASIRIADARTSDIVGLAEILNDAIRTTTAVWFDEPKTPGEMTAWHGAKERERLPVLVALTDDNDVVGYATYGPFRPWPGYRHTVEHSIYVRAGARRKGIGEALLRALMERARADDIHAMVGGIEAENAPSIALHEKLGFVEVARMPQVGWKFGRWLTLVFMQHMM